MAKSQTLDKKNYVIHYYIKKSKVLDFAIYLHLIGNFYKLVH